jgi:putative endonuclease
MGSTRWEVYIIETETGMLYTGITSDMERRLQQHRTSKGAKFFHFSSPEKIVFRESHPNRSSASKRESAIKKMSRQEKLLLIDSVK